MVLKNGQRKLLTQKEIRKTERKRKRIKRKEKSTNRIWKEK
jgi:hypothetical protein